MCGGQRQDDRVGLIGGAAPPGGLTRFGDLWRGVQDSTSGWEDDERCERVKRRAESVSSINVSGVLWIGLSRAAAGVGELLLGREEVDVVCDSV